MPSSGDSTSGLESSLILKCLSRPPLNPSSWPQTNIFLGRRPFYLLLHRPKGLVSYMAFPSGFVIHVDGSHVPSHSSLTSWLRPRILQFLTLTSRSSWYSHLMTSSEMTETNYCCVPFVPSKSTCPVLSRN